MTTPDRRILFVHAHPDDETIGNGTTMAKYVAEGAQVTLVTCTAGEEGEVLVPELEHLAVHHDDALGPHRVKELRDAMAVLGVTDFRFLGGEGHFRDSGMKWAEDGTATAADETRHDTFWSADLTVASDLLVAIIREVRTQVMVTYDQFGNYGHPDHVQAHRVATYASEMAAVRSYRPDLGEPWQVAKFYWSAMAKSQLAEGIRHLRAAGDTTTFEGWDPDNLPWGSDDHELDAVIDGNDYVDAKMDAMRAHATQIALDGPFFALSNNLGNEVWGAEHYRLAQGQRGPVGPDGLETDLFAGL
ncbi:MAG: N-acetyl-1-D-myo-inositol-2-amino-2-deoxy-alpha-D-glucopyranoside deacetylase [Aeromicrobium sp.]